MIDLWRRMAWFVPVPNDPKGAGECRVRFSERRTCEAGTNGCSRRHGKLELTWIPVWPDTIQDIQVRTLLTRTGIGRARPWLPTPGQDARVKRWSPWED